MEEVVQDIDTLRSVEEELAELERKKQELLGVRGQIEDKYDLVTPEQKTQREFKEVLLASDKLIEAQIYEADFYKMDKSSLLENQIITQEELVRVEEAELDGKFGKFSDERESTLKLPLVNEEEYVHEDEFEINYGTDYIIDPSTINIGDIELFDDEDFVQESEELVEEESSQEEVVQESEEFVDVESKKEIKAEDVELSAEEEEQLKKVHATLSLAQKKRDNGLSL